MHRLSIAFLAVLATALPLPVAAQTTPSAASPAAPYDRLDAGPRVGSSIPHDLGTVDQDGQHQDFRSLVRARGLMVLFNRSVDW